MNNIDVVFWWELTFLKELMLIRQENQNSAIFTKIGIFSIKPLSFSHIYAGDAIM